MSDEVLVDHGAELSQGARVVDTFVAPSKTFTDILRKATCWLPLVIVVLTTFIYGYAIDKKVGFSNVVEQQIAKNPKAEERMASLTPEQREKNMTIQGTVTKYITYCSFTFVFIIFAIEALIFWGSFNFIMGAQTKFSQCFAVVVFAALPRSLLVPLLSAVLLFSGVGIEGFDIQNPVGTNIGYYLSTSPKWMQSAGQFFDIFGLWSLALMVLGMAIVARKTITQSATVVLGWWVLILLIVVGFAAATS